MSSVLSNLLQKLHSHDENRAVDTALDHFNHSDQPYNDLFECLIILLESSHKNNRNLVSCLLQSFLRWQNQSDRKFFIPNFDKTSIDSLIMETLPIIFLKDFCKIFQISKKYLVSILRIQLNNPMDSNVYKRALNIVVELNYQFEFFPDEILLPLILNTKDHLIHVYVNKKRQLEEYLLDLLNYLYQNGGKRLREILSNEFHIRNTYINKKALGKLAVRYWDAFGNEEVKRYPNLANLQNRRALNYLISVKYYDHSVEKTMSDEAWNELVEVKKTE